MHIFRVPPESYSRALLANCDLPTGDLQSDDFEHFIGCGQSDCPGGIVGLQQFGSVGLLRSLAVAEHARGQGCGKLLVAAAEDQAGKNGVADLYLLTTTAADFFSRLGYAPTLRAEAPEEIRNTQEFSALCPDAAVLMVKRLPKADDG